MMMYGVMPFIAAYEKYYFTGSVRIINVCTDRNLMLLIRFKNYFTCLHYTYVHVVNPKVYIGVYYCTS